MKYYLTLSLLLFGVVVAVAQQKPVLEFRTIEGNIILKNNKPCKCSIMIYSTNMGTRTDTAGSFKWNVPKQVPILLTVWNLDTREKYTVKVNPADKFLKIRLDKAAVLASAKNIAEPYNADYVIGLYQTVQYYKFIGKPMPDIEGGSVEVPTPRAMPGPNDTTVYNSVERLPNYKDGTSGWYKYLADSVKVNQGDLHGKVFVQFIVEKDGSLSHVRLLRGLCDRCDKEALRVVRASPKWTPATIGGNAVRCYYNFPVLYGDTQ